MKAIIRTTTRTYRSTHTVEDGNMAHELVTKIDARTKETTILGVPVQTQFSIDGEEKIIKIFGIPILSFRRELWDHHS